MAVEQACQHNLKSITIRCDSDYVVKGITNWVDKWIKNNWTRSGRSKEPVLNRDLWEKLVLVTNSEDIVIKWEHVKGHSGVHGNEEADRLAILALSENEQPVLKPQSDISAVETHKAQSQSDIPLVETYKAQSDIPQKVETLQKEVERLTTREKNQTFEITRLTNLEDKLKSKISELETGEFCTHKAQELEETYKAQELQEMMNALTKGIDKRLSETLHGLESNLTANIYSMYNSEKEARERALHTEKEFITEQKRVVSEDLVITKKKVETLQKEVERLTTREKNQTFEITRLTNLDDKLKSKISELEAGELGTQQKNHVKELEQEISTIRRQLEDQTDSASQIQNLLTKIAKLEDDLTQKDSSIAELMAKRLEQQQKQSTQLEEVISLKNHTGSMEDEKLLFVNKINDLQKQTTLQQQQIKEMEGLTFEKQRLVSCNEKMTEQIASHLSNIRKLTEEKVSLQHKFTTFEPEDLQKQTTLQQQQIKEMEGLTFEKQRLVSCNEKMTEQIASHLSNIRKLTEEKVSLQHKFTTFEPEGNTDGSQNTVKTPVNQMPILFKGPQHFLSNFYECPHECKINIFGKQFKTGEHAYQYRKAIYHEDFELAEQVLMAENAHNAKSLGNDIHNCNQGWQERKTEFMENIVGKKITGCPHITQKLINTDSAPLIEDVRSSPFWGSGPDGNGNNVLGKILEKERAKLLNNTHSSPVSTEAKLSSSLMSADAKPSRPQILLIGNSQINDIDVNKVTHQVTISKHLAFTIEEAKEHSDTTQYNEFDLVILHLVTNDVKKHSADQCVYQLCELIEIMKEKGAHKIVISVLSSRQDSKALELKTQQVELSLQEIFTKDNQVTICNHELDDTHATFKEDGVHLTRYGTICLAAGLRTTIQNELKLENIRSKKTLRKSGPPRFKQWNNATNNSATNGQQWMYPSAFRHIGQRQGDRNHRPQMELRNKGYSHHHYKDDNQHYSHYYQDGGYQHQPKNELNNVS